MSLEQVRAPMPGDPLPRRRGWAIGAGGLLVLMAVVAWWSITASSVPNGYLARRGWEVGIDGPWPFPREELRTWLSAMAVEGGVSIWVLSARVKMSLAMRSLLLGLGTLGVLLALLPLVMHASAPFPQHLSWLLLSMTWLLLFSLLSGIAEKAWPSGAGSRF